MTRYTSIRYSSSCYTRVNMGASIFFTAAMIPAFRSARSRGIGGTNTRCLIYIPKDKYINISIQVVGGGMHIFWRVHLCNAGLFKILLLSVNPFAYRPAGRILKNCSLGEFEIKIMSYDYSNFRRVRKTGKCHY